MNKIDLNYVDKQEEVICLALVVDLDWSDPQAALNSIANKLQWYVSYILDGQMDREYPELKKRRIVVWCSRPMPKKAFELCGILCNQVARQGVDAIMSFTDDLWMKLEH